MTRKTVPADDPSATAPVPTASPIEAFDRHHALEILFKLPTELERADNYRSYPHCIHSASLGGDE